MNKVIISGNLTKDMDVMVSKNDVNIGKFTVAVNNGYGENTNTQFYPVILLTATVNFPMFTSFLVTITSMSFVKFPLIITLYKKISLQNIILVYCLFELSTSPVQ